MTWIEPEPGQPQQSGRRRQTLNDEEFPRTHRARGQGSEHQDRENQKQNPFLAPLVQTLAYHGSDMPLDCGTASIWLRNNIETCSMAHPNGPLTPSLSPAMGEGARRVGEEYLACPEIFAPPRQIHRSEMCVAR